MPSVIKPFAIRLLSNDEIAIAKRIQWLIDRRKMKKAQSLVEEIFPKYWAIKEEIPYTLYPDFVYRSLYYLDHPKLFLTDSSYIVHKMGEHLESLLKLLPGSKSNLSLGAQSQFLKGKALPSDLAHDLLEFNSVADIPAKHSSANTSLPSRLDVRSFTLEEITLLLMVMRRLSISLFAILKNQGINLREGWKAYDPDWAKWNRLSELYPAVIAAREHSPN